MKPGVSITTLVVLACVGGCAVPLEATPREIPESEIPSGLGAQGPEPSTPEPQDERADVWFIRDEQLVSSTHRIAQRVSASGALSELLAGPTAAEQERALRSAIPDPEAVEGVAVRGGVATVSLGDPFAEISASDQILAIAQIVLTLTDVRGVGRVRFAVDDDPVGVPLPTGESAVEVSRDDFEAMTASR